MKTPVQLIPDKLIMSLEELPTSNSPRQIYHPKLTILTKDTIVLDVILHKYFKNLFLDEVICENCSSSGSESIKSTFTLSIYLKNPPSFKNEGVLSKLKILFQRGNSYMTTYVATKKNLKLLYLMNIFTNNHQVIRIYHTP